MARRRLAISGAIAALLLVMFTGRVAMAQPTVNMTTKPVVDPKRKDVPSDVQVTVIGGAPLPIEKFTLTQVDAKVPVAMKAISLRSYAEGSEAISLVVVIEGHEVWMGNESYIDNEEDKYTGVFNKLGAAFEPLSKLGPPGSQGGLVVYGTSVDVKKPMGPIGELTGAVLGTQKDYSGNTSRDLVNGIDKALAMLHESPTARKALVYIGDGADTNLDAARERMVQLRKQAEQWQIELYGIQYVAEGFESEGGVVKALIPELVVAQSMESIGSSAEALAGKINDRYYLTFPGWDPTLKAGFTWDGLSHELMLKIDQTELEPISLALLPKWALKKKSSFPWLAIILPVVGIILLVILVKVFGGKKVAAPEPMLAAPVFEQAPAPKGGPMKTVMIGAGGDADGFPVVGWLVPLNGSQQHQTFRLQQGITNIGTGGNAQIVVDDGFMSTEHFQIAGSPHGFTLIDNKSTNGTFVNDNKVDRQELYDNDVITVGKTNIIFKSIN